MPFQETPPSFHSLLISQWIGRVHSSTVLLSSMHLYVIPSMAFSFSHIMLVEFMEAWDKPLDLVSPNQCGLVGRILFELWTYSPNNRAIRRRRPRREYCYHETNPTHQVFEALSWYFFFCHDIAGAISDKSRTLLFEEKNTSVSESNFTISRTII